MGEIVEVLPDEWPGAQAKIVPPVTVEVCCAIPDFNELCLAEGIEGRGVTRRAGVAFAKRSVEEIEAACAAPYPDVIGRQFPSRYEGQTQAALGTAFGSEGGTCWLADAVAWENIVTKIAQVDTLWQDNRIEFTVDVEGDTGKTWYIHVTAICGSHTDMGIGFLVLNPP